LGATFGMILNDTSAKDDDNTAWNDTEPTSSVFSVGTSANTNGSGSTFIAYCFAEKQGFSKFGSYTGNGSADGTFVYTGFKPAFCIIKRTDSAGYSWATYDSTRYPENKSTIPALWSNASDAEGSYSTIDFLSNGIHLHGICRKSFCYIYRNTNYCKIRNLAITHNLVYFKVCYKNSILNLVSIKWSQTLVENHNGLMVTL
jgi:hypothetical protein